MGVERMGRRQVQWVWGENGRSAMARLRSVFQVLGGIL